MSVCRKFGRNNGYYWFIVLPECSKSLISRNSHSSTNGVEMTRMQQHYALLNKKCEEHITTFDQVNPRDVFVNNEVKLSKIQVYGFDYDYTLAHYTSALDEFIFNESRNWLVEQMKGLLMKVDAFHHIQLDTVYRGFKLLSLDEILKVYRGSHLSSDILKQKFTPNDTIMIQLMDLFRLPEINLLCSIIDFFDRHGIDYKPVYVYQDVSTAVARVHKSGLLGQTVMSDPERYIAKAPELSTFLYRLVKNNKKLFVISNSSAAYMQFRRTDISGTFKHWEAVQTFKRGQIYEGVCLQLLVIYFHHNDNNNNILNIHFPIYDIRQCFSIQNMLSDYKDVMGCLEQMIKLTGWSSASILYFGDHVYADLAVRFVEFNQICIQNNIDVASTYGWMTGAVIPELESELIAANNHDFKINLKRLRMLERLIQENQHVHTAEAKLLLEKWLDERNALRRASKCVFNPQFGSIFRSFHNPSYFSQRLGQYATLYTSRVTNLLHFPLDHAFFPKRTALPHESF
ncbi:uncharacterized protein DC041_0007715 [Schistosoma bovis]|uniref:5'-nucleotidase domain-containing protein 3 n=1 Tax=Schistosoma bovis TaxID=6184 RepID=A0A430QED7_SCHBO|nr:uncharacterized protein DC041_0007715 [Schistosoma bovis]